VDVFRIDRGFVFAWPAWDNEGFRLLSSSAITSPILALFLRFLGRPESSSSSSSGVSGLWDAVLSLTGEISELLRLFGGDQEVGLVARVGAALIFLSRHPNVASCSAEIASVVSFADWGTKFTRLKLVSDPNRISSIGWRVRRL
jgi:hypothetical protein